MFVINFKFNTVWLTTANSGGILFLNIGSDLLPEFLY